MLLVGCAPESPSTTPGEGTSGEAEKTETPEADKAPAPASDKAPAAAKKEPAAAGSLVVYSGRGAVLVGPLLKQFTDKTGVQVQVRYEKSTEVLANRLATEGAQTEADVFFAQDSGWLGALAKAEHLAALPQALLDQVPAHYRDAGGRWVGTSGRARVLVYSPARVKTTELPKTLEELAVGPWKGRMGWAPSNGSYQAHVSALRHIWGEEKTRGWLTAVKGLNPTVYPKNSPQVKAVSNGEIDLGWVNHYYLHKLKAANPELKAANHSFPTAGDPGNLMMLSGVAITTHTKNEKGARALVEFLISAAAQEYFAQKTFEYPTRPGVALHPDVPPIGDGLVRADQTHLTDLSGTLEMLRSLGLQ